MRLGILVSHPIQYYAPLYRALAQQLDLQVYYAHRQTPEGQARAGFGVAFEWDIPLLDGYPYAFLHNRSRQPDTTTSRGCDTPEIADLLARERFDAFLVHGWYNRSYRQAIRAAWRTRTPLLVRGDSHLRTPRSTLKRAAKEVLYRWFVPRFDRYLVVGERAREYYLHYGADPARMVFCPHFVDNEAFQARAAAVPPGALRREIGARAEALVVLFVGKFISEKRPGDLVRAAYRLQSEGQPVHLVFVGAGELEPMLRAETALLGVPTAFAGFKNQTELPFYYAGADVLVLPSDGETWGLVVNEAMACGTPAVVSDAVGCAPDLIEPGRTGYVFPVGDVEALARALAKTVQLRHDPSLPLALARKMATYSLETATEGVLEAMRSLPTRRPADVQTGSRTAALVSDAGR